MSKKTDRDALTEKAKNKQLDFATTKWQNAQMAAAQAAETLDKALAVVLLHKDELSEAQIEEIYEQMRLKKDELKSFLIEEQRKYAEALDAVNLEAVVYDKDELPQLKLVNLEDL
jgi:acyl-CoA reductase-like NAD-dependent aldehyde dehydrogenase